MAVQIQDTIAQLAQTVRQATDQTTRQWEESMSNMFGGESPFLKAWETWLSDQLDNLMRNEAFLGKMGKALGNSFQMKAQIDRFLEQSLQSLRLPSRGDLDEVVKRLDQLERRLDALTEAIEKKATPAAKTTTK